ncbi:glycoside hydrolase superfamily [Aspergillus karnatakaensis]|uniref:glycoside hydrolase family 3 protein n=1 Tax=Aspergillus karnatakaensis TaxID=1810916 RepID=UPI003CCD8E89
MASALLDIEILLQKLTLDEKVLLLSGIGRCRTRGFDAHGIPSIQTSDGPHGVRSERFFNQPKVAALPSGTGQGATFDKDLLYKVGALLAAESKAHRVQLLLAPVVCLQRSPLIGRGFEAFGEDPILSGTLGGQFIRGLQDNGIAACIKHYAAHDQSHNSIEDNCIMTERTLREVHTLPFQVAIRDSDPWAVMSSYNKINGVHVSENPKLLKKILREDWGYQGLAINAGLDLEMPGPPDFRGKNLALAVRSRKVSMETVDSSVRRLLELINRIVSGQGDSVEDPNTEGARALIRKLTADSVVLLKNDNGVLSLSRNTKNRFALIGDHWTIPAVAGGGSSEVEPYYVSTPYDAFIEAIDESDVSTALGCYSHRFAPLLPLTWLKQPGSSDQGLLVEVYDKDFRKPEAKLLYRASTPKTFLHFMDSLPEALPEGWFARIRTTMTPDQSVRYRFGLSGAGKFRLFIDEKERIDLWTSHPEKTDSTSCFSAFTMERFADLDLEKGQAYDLEIHLVNEELDDLVGAAPAGGVRLGGFEIVDEDETISQAVDLARNVDITIILTGLSGDYEYEGTDRKTLGLPGRVDELIQRVVEANPNAVIITEAGTAISMPWADKAKTIVHGWLGGQETGHGLVDVLFGNVNPSGRLPLTFPRRLEDTPAFLNFAKSDHDIVYGEGVFIGHRYYEKVDRPPQFYFGHGLSYTKFEYNNLVVPSIFECDPVRKMTITVDLKNVEAVTGAEVVQVYVKDVESSVERPSRELKAFKKANLEPCASQTIRIDLDKYAISFWDQRSSKWLAEAGIFETFELQKSFSWTGL